MLDFKIIQGPQFWYPLKTRQQCMLRYDKQQVYAQLGGSSGIESSSISADSVRVLPRVVRAVCEFVYTNQRDRLEHIRSGSARNTRCWANTGGLRNTRVLPVNATEIRKINVSALLQCAKHNHFNIITGIIINR